MSIRRKAFSIGTSAALIAALLATAAAPAALAAITVSGVGAIPQGGTSATAATFTFVENSAAALTATGTFTVTITPASPGAGTVTFSGTPTLSAPGSLGASVSAAGNVLTIKITGHDDLNIETLVVGGLKITASSGASTGAIVATLGGSSAVYSAFVSGTATATGKLSQAYGPTTSDWFVAVDATSPCNFGGTNNVTVGSETLVVTSVGALNAVTVGQQEFITAGMTNNHLANEVVTQSVANCTPTSMASPGTVATVANQNSSVTEQGNNPTTVNPGEQNQAAGTTTLAEKAAGFIPVGTLTFTLSAPGVQFSAPPTVGVSQPLALLNPTVLTATATNGAGLLAVGTYCYEVAAITVAGTTTPSAATCAAVGAVGGQVALAWTAVAGATGYNVYGRPATSGGLFALFGAAPTTTTATTYTDNGSVTPSGLVAASNTALIAVPGAPTATLSSAASTLTVGDHFQYKVTAVTAAGETTVGAASTLITTAGTFDSVSLSWTAVDGATGYNVYGRNDTAVPTYLLMTPAPISATTFLDSGSVTPTLGVPGANTATIAVPTAPTATASNNAGNLAANTYYYVVTAVNAAGQTMASNEASDTLSAPGSIALAWTAVAGVTSYNVYRGLAVGAETLLTTGVATNSFVDNGSYTAIGTALPTSNTTRGTALTLGSTLCNLSFDRTSCSVAVTAVSVGLGSTITLSNIHLDVASTVPTGTAINVTVTSSPAMLVNVLSNTIAYVARVAVGVATQPVIFINYNDQPTGLISITEAGPGFFVGGTDNDNTFGLCLVTGESFTRAPYAVVTKGDLSIRNGLVGASSVLGTLYTDHYGNSCAYWTVWTASTVASTVEIRGSDSSGAVLPTGATNGPRLSVPASLAPGTTQGVILIGTFDAVHWGADVLSNGGIVTSTTNTPAFSSLVSMATRAFKSGVVVAAVSQPFIPAGTADSLAGNLTISETLNGQFKPGQFICVTILPRTSNGVRTQDTFIKTATTNDLPVITTNSASGLLTATVATPGCPPDFSINDHSFVGFPFLPNPGASFSFRVSQQSFGTLGVITISNIHLITTADAVNGTVLVDVMGDNGGGAVQFESVVSNARIGVAPATSGLTGIAFITQTRLGATKFGTFTAATKVAALGKYQTWRFAGGSALAGKIVSIWKATKNASGTWSAFTRLTSRLADSSGNAFFWWRSSSKTWVSVRASYAGDATHFLSWSVARQARWL